MDQKFVIAQSQAQKIADYLVTKPFMEVAHLVSLLTQLPPLPPLAAVPEQPPTNPDPTPPKPE